MNDAQIDLSKAKPFIFELSFDAEDMAERRRKKLEERETVFPDLAKSDEDNHGEG